MSSDLHAHARVLQGGELAARELEHTNARKAATTRAAVLMYQREREPLMELIRNGDVSALEALCRSIATERGVTIELRDVMPEHGDQGHSILGFASGKADERGRSYPFIRPDQVVCGAASLGQPRELVQHVMGIKRRVDEGKRRRDAREQLGTPGPTAPLPPEAATPGQVDAKSGAPAVEARPTAVVEPAPAVGVKVALLLPPSAHPLQRVGATAWRWLKALRHVDVVLHIYYALLGLVTVPLLVLRGSVMGALAMALVGGLFCWLAVFNIRLLRPQPLLDDDDSEWGRAALSGKAMSEGVSPRIARSSGPLGSVLGSMASFTTLARRDERRANAIVRYQQRRIFAGTPLR